MKYDEEYRTYLFTYTYQGRDWGFGIPATSEEDAIARLKHIADARYDGVLHSTEAVAVN